jgi:hypothetical protein
MSRGFFQSDTLSSRVVQWLSSLVLSALIVIGAIALILFVADWGYIRSHPVAAYEEDLGYGLVMIGVVLSCAVVALPAGGILAWYIKKIITRKVNECKHP